MDCSRPDSSVHEILQARILEWVAIPSSRGSSHPKDRTQVYRIAGGFFTVWATRKDETLEPQRCNYWAPTCCKYWSPWAWSLCSTTREDTTARSPSTTMKGSPPPTPPPHSLQLGKAREQQWRSSAAKNQIKLIKTTLTYPRRRQWQPIPVLLPGKSHGRRSLVGCGPWGR